MFRKKFIFFKCISPKFIRINTTITNVEIGYIFPRSFICYFFFVSGSFGFLSIPAFKLLPNPRIVVSYADTEQEHIGVVYQATNFLYTGLSDKRTEWRLRGSNLHSKTVC